MSKKAIKMLFIKINSFLKHKYYRMNYLTQGEKTYFAYYKGDKEIIVKGEIIDYRVFKTNQSEYHYYDNNPVAEFGPDQYEMQLTIKIIPDKNGVLKEVKKTK